MLREQCWIKWIFGSKSGQADHFGIRHNETTGPRDSDFGTCGWMQMSDSCREESSGSSFWNNGPVGGRRHCKHDRSGRAVGHRLGEAFLVGTGNSASTEAWARETGHLEG